MAAHSSVLAWRIPGTEEPRGLPSVGSHRVGHDWSDLAAAAACFFIISFNFFDTINILYVRSCFFKVLFCSPCLILCIVLLLFEDTSFLLLCLRLILYMYKLICFIYFYLLFSNMLQIFVWNVLNSFPSFCFMSSQQSKKQKILVKCNTKKQV